MRYSHPILKPLFMAIARQPLIGPHSNHEMELLLSGAKPVGMFASGYEEEKINTLQQKVETGTLLRLDVPRTFTNSYILYGWPAAELDTIASAKTEHIAAFNKGAGNNVYTHLKYLQATAPSKLAEYGEAQLPLNSRDRNLHMLAKQVVRLLPPALSSMLNAQWQLRASLERKNAEEFIDGDRQAYMTRLIHGHPYLPRDIREKINSHLSQGLIQCRKFDCEKKSDMVIFGQIGQEKNMDDLSFILRNYDSSEVIENNDRGITHLSEGQILGYSDQDIELFQNRAAFSNLHRFVLSHTQDLRRDIRTDLMKEMGSQWNRNP